MNDKIVGAAHHINKLGNVDVVRWELSPAERFSSMRARYLEPSVHEESTVIVLREMPDDTPLDAAVNITRHKIMNEWSAIIHAQDEKNRVHFLPVGVAQIKILSFPEKRDPPVNRWLSDAEAALSTIISDYDAKAEQRLETSPAEPSESTGRGCFGRLC